LRPLLGDIANIAFSIGLLCVSMNPFVINAMSGGAIISDGLGQPARFSDKLPRRFTVLALLVGMTVAMLVLHTSFKPINAIIIGQALTVLANPLVALSLMWMSNNKKIMGEHTNHWAVNLIGFAGVIVVLFMAFRVAYRLILQLS
jgi:Mn2+/Fe2+ NRAMP family transporter